MRDFNENKAVARLAEIVALECGVHPAVAKRLAVAASLHDIGKQKLDSNIINKPGKLTAAEFETVKTHTILGVEMLKNIRGELGKMARNICLLHHEWWSGGGYYGKSSCELPAYLPAVSIADVYTALVCERVYKPAYSREEALDYIQAQSGTQFSPALVRVFVPLVRNDSRVKAIFERRNEVNAGRFTK